MVACCWASVEAGHALVALLHTPGLHQGCGGGRGPCLTHWPVPHPGPLPHEQRPPPWAGTALPGAPPCPGCPAPPHTAGGPAAPSSGRCGWWTLQTTGGLRLTGLSAHWNTPVTWWPRRCSARHGCRVWRTSATTQHKDSGVYWPSGASVGVPRHTPASDPLWGSPGWGTPQPLSPSHRMDSQEVKLWSVVWHCAWRQQHKACHSLESGTRL